MISREDYEFITKLDNANPEHRKIICSEQAHQCALTFLNLLGYISKDATLQYILTMIDDLIEEDPARYGRLVCYVSLIGRIAYGVCMTMSVACCRAVALIQTKVMAR